MPNEISRLKPNQVPSFDEFKKNILERDSDTNFPNRLRGIYENAPRLIRILHNFDPTGTASALDQLINDEKTEREQNNILRMLYDLAVKIWKVEGTELPSLSVEKFKFLYFVYIKSETDVYARVLTDEIQSILTLPQLRTVSIGEYLNRNELINFSNWIQGIKIMHKGIVRVEAELLGNNELPDYVSQDEIKKMEERIRLRFHLLQNLYREAKEDTFKKISHANLAIKAGLEHHRTISQFLPYMIAEGWVKSRTVDSISITEEGIDRVKTLLI